MNKRIIVEIFFLILILGFSGTTFPVSADYVSSGSGIGSNSDETFEVLRIHDLIHVEGSVSGMITLVITDINNNTILNVGAFFSVNSFDLWIKVNNTYSADYFIDYSYLGEYQYEFTISAMGGFWR